MEKMMKMRVVLSVALFILGLFYWTAGNSFIKDQKQENTTFQSIYALTGNQDKTVDILKCADEKSIQCVFNEECSKEVDAKEYHQECLNDWLNTELQAVNQ